MEGEINLATELDNLPSHIALFLDPSKVKDIEQVMHFLRSKHPHNSDYALEESIVYDEVYSNSSYKDRLKEILDAELKNRVHIVPIQNFRGSSFQYAKAGAVVVFERLKKLSAAILYGLTDTMIVALERNGVMIIPDETIEVSIATSSDDSINNEISKAPRSNIKQLVHSNTIDAHNRAKKAIRVALIDTGIDTSHNEFKGKHREIRFFGRNEDGRLSECSPKDDACYHGSQVGSVLAGQNIGVVPNAHLAVCGIMQKTNANQFAYSTKDLVQAINWLLSGPFEGGAKPTVINFSFGTDALEPVLKAQVKKVADQGQSLCFAATGDGSKVNNCPYPAGFDASWVLSIGGVDTKNRALPASNYDADLNFETGNPNFSALGTDVTAAYPNGSYSVETGSSFASAIAAGIAGILGSFAETYNKRKVVDALRDNTIPGTGGLQTGHGVLRLSASLIEG